MAFTASHVAMVRNGGSDSANGGGFDRGVSGMSTNGAATSATGTAPVFTSASYNFVAGDVGHWVYIKSGTNWTPGWYLIASVAANAATLTASIGTATMDDGGLNTVAGCATTASPTGATWSIDYSRADANKIVYTDIVINAGTNTNATSAANPFTINQVGNVWTVISGTGFTVQRVTMVSLSGVTATFDKSLGTLGSTGGNAKMGGAYASPGGAGLTIVSGSWVYIKYHATAYSTSTTSANVSGGYLACQDGTAYATPQRILGFDVTPGDETANRPTFKHGVVSGNELMTIGHYLEVANLILDGNSTAFASGNCRGTYHNGLYQLIRKVKYTNFANNAANLPGGGTGAVADFIECEFTACATVAALNIATAATGASVKTHSCNFHDNTFDAIKSTASNGSLEVVNCIFDTNKSGATRSGIWFTSTMAMTVINSTFYNQGLDGIKFDAACPALIVNSVFESNGQYGINAATGNLTTTINCAFYNNASGKYPASKISRRNVIGEIIPSASVFNSPASHDFSLNGVTTGGLLLKATAFPATFPSGLTVHKLDVGAAQSVNTSPATLVSVFGS